MASHPAAQGAGGSGGSHYEALGVAPDASGEDIRRAFRRAALQLHPDKAAAAGAAGAASGSVARQQGCGAAVSAVQAAAAAERGEQFLRLQAAYAALSDPVARATHDAALALAAAAQQVVVADTVDWGALAPCTLEGEACLAWPCRCGGCFAVAAGEAGEAAAEAAAGAAGGELLLPCTTCSLHIAVRLPGGA
eukprot:scaffold9.g3041.t1